MAENFGASFSIDITQLKAGLAQANRLIRESESQFKAAAAGMDDWTKSQDGLEKKIKSLNDIAGIQEKKVEALKSEYNRLISEGLDPTSAKATDLRTKINNETAALEKSKAEIMKQQNALGQYRASIDDASSGSQTLTEKVKSQEKELQALKSQYANVAAEQGKSSSEAQDLAKQISDLSGDLKENKTKLDDASKAADDLDQSLTDAGDAAKEASDGGFTIMKGALANIASEAIMGAIGALKDLGAALVDVGKQAVENYADYEQLAGGVETLFGAGGQSVEEYAKSVGKSVEEAQGEYNKLMNAQDTVIQNANDAYKTAGLSANEYIETVTGFSASMVSSLGGDTEKAASLADQAIVDMADNANKMGTSIGDIQNAYQGFAKQNYTMLDNLKLGYGGTKEEMERLLADAEKLTGKKYDVSNFADITEAIHAVQEEMGIAGTTAKEATATISGSLGSMQSAWQNLLTGIATGENVGQLVENFVDGVLTAADNLIPVVEQVINTLADVIVELIDKLFPEVISLIQKNAPNIIKSLMKLIKEVAKALLDALPELVSTLADIIVEIVKALGEMLPEIVEKIVDVIPEIIDALLDAVPELIDAGVELLMGLVDAIPKIIPKLVKAIPKIIDKISKTLKKSLPKIIDGAVQLLMGIVKAIPEIIPPLVEALPDIISSIVNLLIENIPVLLDGAVQLLMAIINAIPVIIEALVPQIPTIIDTIVQTLMENIPVLLDAAVQLFMALVEAIPQIALALAEALPQIVTTIIETLISPVTDLFGGLWESIKDIFAPVGEFFGAAWDTIKNAFSSVAETLGGFFKNAWTNIKNAFSSVGSFFSGIWGTIKSAFASVGNWFKSIFQTAWTNIKKVFSGVGDFFGGIWDTIKSKFTTIGTKVAKAIGGAFKSAINAVIGVVEDAINFIPKAINKAIKLINKLPGVEIDKMPSIELPRLAKGGVVTQATNAIVGEDGAEAIMPLERNTGWIDKLAEKIAEKSGGGVTVNQTNNYSQAHSRYELYKSQQATKAAVKLAMMRG